MTLSTHQNVWILTIAQALMMSGASFVVFVGGIIGSQFAPDQSLATLPVASLIIGTAISTLPVAYFMKKLGRKVSFLMFAGFGIVAALLAAHAIIIESFCLFCVSIAMLGTMVASINHFRFAAMESVTTAQMAKAASTVLLGGIAAAFIGPETATIGRFLLKTEFVGSFLLLAGLFGMGIVTLLFFTNIKTTESSKAEQGRPILSLILQPVFVVAVAGSMFGYAIMSFIMTATPISMHIQQGLSMSDTKFVIQSHIIAMFLPSLVVPMVVARIGVVKLMYAGIGAFIVCILIALSGKLFINYWLALVLLGIGWNFLFIGGTTLLPLAYQPNEKFKIQAVNEFVVFTTQAIASLSAGYVVHHLGWETVLMINIPILLLPTSAIVYYHLTKS